MRDCALDMLPFSLVPFCNSHSTGVDVDPKDNGNRVSVCVPEFHSIFTPRILTSLYPIREFALAYLVSKSCSCRSVCCCW